MADSVQTKITQMVAAQVAATEVFSTATGTARDTFLVALEAFYIDANRWAQNPIDATAKATALASWATLQASVNALGTQVNGAQATFDNSLRAAWTTATSAPPA